jgi:hypothetical protein
MKQLSILLFVCITIITNAQNVGIGTNTPQAKLDVNGNVKITDGTQGAGKVLTSNVNGEASWQPNNSNGNIGFGPWGDCAVSGLVSDYQPTVDNEGSPADEYGISVSISGDYAIVGAPRDDEGFIDNGSATIYKRNSASGTWEPQGSKLVNPSAADGDFFGWSVSISNDYAIVGAPSDDEGGLIGNGSATIFKRNPVTGNWEPQGSKLVNLFASTNDFFGGSVSISGDYAIVGSERDDEVGFTDNGSATIFKRNATTGIWEAQGSKLINLIAGISDYFGSSVSISGDYAIVGAPFDDEGILINTGSATVFKRNSTTGIWQQQGLELFNSSAGNSDFFGSSVSISGDYAIVGAPSDDNIGSATIFKRSNITGVWLPHGNKINITTAEILANFGWTVSISDDYALIGAFSDDEGGLNNNGSATIYKKLGNNWIRKIKFVNPSGSNNGRFGHSVGIDGITKQFIVGETGNGGLAIFGKTSF